MTVKFMQWYQSRCETLFEDDIFEKNDIHDIAFTNEVVKKHNIDVNIHECIASGSIGQVYRGSYENKDVAIKVRHPNVLEEIQCPMLFVRLILYFAAFMGKKHLRLSNYFDFEEFFEIFNLQLNFTNEGNTMEYIKSVLGRQDYIIIPNVVFKSEDLLIMSYHDGKSISEIRSDTEKHELINLVSCFMRICMYFANMVHGDMHEGNFKYDNGKLIVYDFGIMAKGNGYAMNQLLHTFQYVDHSVLIHLILKEFTNGCTDDEKKRILQDENFLSAINRPPNIINILQQSCIFLEKYNKVVSNTAITLLMSYGLLEKQFAKYGIQTNNDKTIQEQREWYRSFLIKQLAFCRLKNIFPELQDDFRSKLKIMTNLQKEIFPSTLQSPLVSNFYSSLRKE